MKIFSISDCEWYAAEDLESAIQCAMVDSGLSREELMEDAEEVPEFAMHALKYSDMDENENITVTRTFAEQLAIELKDGQPFPRFFASTEY